MLKYDDEVRITKEVVLGLTPARKDSKEEAAYRAKIKKDKEKADKDGVMLTFPTEWDGGFEE